MSDEELTFTVSSGNVFADLGFPDPDAALAKAKLAAAISGAIVDQGLSQTEAARVRAHAAEGLCAHARAVARLLAGAAHPLPPRAAAERGYCGQLALPPGERHASGRDPGAAHARERSIAHSAAGTLSCREGDSSRRRPYVR